METGSRRGGGTLTLNDVAPLLKTPQTVPKSTFNKFVNVSHEFISLTLWFKNREAKAGLMSDGWHRQAAVKDHSSSDGDTCMNAGEPEWQATFRQLTFER